MRSKPVIFVIVAALAAALVAVLVAVAGADQSSSLASISAQDLLAKMAQQGHQTQNISGEVAWHNGLLGDLSSLGNNTMGALPAQLPLVGDGSGRIWVSRGTGTRIESQGGNGDQQVIINAKDRTAWVYDFSKNTAQKIVTTASAQSSSSPQPSPSMTALTPDMITALMQRLAPYASLKVVGQTKVAGQDSYLLRLTPAASDTALGYVQVAVDGTRYVPLQMQVVAKGGSAAVLQFGFTKVSYNAIAPSTFEFTPPAGAKVTTKTIDLSRASNQGHSSGLSAQQKAQAKQLAQSTLLTVPEAQKLVPFTVLRAQSYTARPFDFAAVVAKGGPLTAMGKPLATLLGMSGTGSTASQGSQTGSAGPTVVLVYGKGFGTMVLAETQTTTALENQLKQLPVVVDTTTLNGAKVHALTTPLGGVYIWQQGNTTLVAGGLVTKADLQAFASSVR